MTVKELIASLEAYDPNATVYIPGWGSSDGSWLKVDETNVAIIAPSEIMFRLYKKAPEEAYEFAIDNSPEWNEKHGTKGVLIR